MARRTSLGAGFDRGLSVADTDLGIDAFTASRIFEPFFTTKPPGRGGLGLSVAFGAVRRCGRFIEVESEPGIGATFHVHLPEAASPGGPRCSTS